MNKSGKTILIVIWVALLIWGLTGVVQRFTQGHDLANYGSYVPWGLWVSAYIYFVGLSAGAFLLSSLIYVFGIKELERIGRLALFVAAVTLPLALVCILFDLGQMWRSYEVFTRPNWSSMMAWMVWLYSAYFILILTEMWFDMRCDLAQLRDRGGALAPLYRILALGWRCPDNPEELEACHRQSMRVLRVLGGLGVPLAISFHGGVGALFATLSAKPLWHSGLFPVLFLTGALVSGGALILAIVALMGNDAERGNTDTVRLLGRMVLGLLLFDLLLEWAEFSIPMWYAVGPEFESLYGLLFGEFWYVFWIFHILLGAAIPIVLLIAKPASRGATFVAGSLVAVTFLAVRLNIVIPAQLTPALKGLAEAYNDPRLRFAYVPSAFEWSVVAFVVAVGIGLFCLGRRYLPLTEPEAQTI